MAQPLRSLASHLGLSDEEAASGILEIAETAMAGALRVISVERGFDPAGFVLVAFGGAGGLHAVRLAESVGVDSILVPPDPGLLSAFGMLAAPIQREETRTLFLSTGDPELAAALTYARRRRIGPYRPAGDRAAARARDLAALSRQGFDYDVARRVIDADDPEDLVREAEAERPD